MLGKEAETRIETNDGYYNRPAIRSSLDSQRARADMISKARTSSRAIDDAMSILSINSPDLHQKIIDQLQQLEVNAESHPKPRYPERLDKILRKIPGRDSSP